MLPRLGLCGFVDAWPDWLLVAETKDRIPADMWPEAAECVATYLHYARKQHDIEFTYLSFPDPCRGQVRFAPEEYGPFLEAVGTQLERHRIRTKLLLSDTGRLGNFPWYLQAAGNGKQGRATCRRLRKSGCIGVMGSEGRWLTSGVGNALC